MGVVCLQALVFFGIGNAVSDMSLGNSPLGLVLLALALALAATGLGMLVAALAHSSRQADNLGMVLGFVLAAAGGCIGYPLFRMGGLIGVLSRLIQRTIRRVARRGFGRPNCLIRHSVFRVILAGSRALVCAV